MKMFPRSSSVSCFFFSFFGSCVDTLSDIAEVTEHQNRFVTFSFRVVLSVRVSIPVSFLSIYRYQYRFVNVSVSVSFMSIYRYFVSVSVSISVSFLPIYQYRYRFLYIGILCRLCRYINIFIVTCITSLLSILYYLLLLAAVVVCRYWCFVTVIPLLLLLLLFVLLIRPATVCSTMHHWHSIVGLFIYSRFAKNAAKSRWVVMLLL